MKESTKNFLQTSAIVLFFVLLAVGFVWSLIWMGEFSEQQTENKAICEYKGGLYIDKVCYKLDGTIDIEEGQ